MMTVTAFLTIFTESFWIQWDFWGGDNFLGSKKNSFGGRENSLAAERMCLRVRIIFVGWGKLFRGEENFSGGRGWSSWIFFGRESSYWLSAWSQRALKTSNILRYVHMLIPPVLQQICQFCHFLQESAILGGFCHFLQFWAGEQPVPSSTDHIPYPRRTLFPCKFYKHKNTNSIQTQYKYKYKYKYK